MALRTRLDRNERTDSSVLVRARRLCSPAFQVVALAVSLSGSAPLASANQFVRLDYSLNLESRFRSTAFIEVFDDKPVTSTNFMAYVNGSRYDGSIMHRLARNFVLQGGGFYPEFVNEPPPVNVSLDPFAEVDLDGNPATANPMIVNEYNVGTIRSNLRGTIAMARKGGQPNSADSQWFISYGNNSGLDTVDGGFTVFAQVVGDGMSFFDVYNSGLGITNLNPDDDDDGFRDSGPFGMNANDGVPFVGNSLLVLNAADRVDYYGAGSTTNIPVGGLTISTRDAYIDTGAMFTGTGSLTIGAGRTLGIREAFNLPRTLINQGTLAPGLNLGAVTVQAYQQAATGTLAMELRGVTLDTLYDRLNVSGAATLAGKLDVDLIGNFAPAAGNTFTLLSAASISGAFTTLDLPALSQSMFWRLSQNSTSLSLIVAGGDYDHNGTVNSADLSVWKSSFGTTVTAFSAGDGNGDGTVNGADFLVWQRSLGMVKNTPIVSAIAAVPEPAAATLAACALAALARRRRCA